MSDADAGIGSKSLVRAKRRAAGGAKANIDRRVAPRHNEDKRPVDLGILQSRAAWSSLHAARLRQQAQTMVDAIGLIGISGAVLGAGGEMLAVNKPFEGLTADLIKEIRGRPRLADPVADRAIEDAVGRLDTAAHAGGPRAVPIRSGNGKPAAIAYVIAVNQTEREPLAGISGLLIIVPLQSRPVPNVQLLQRLFGLSPAEARVACGIAARKTIEEIACDFGVSRETVRSQLKTVLAKTGARRQLDLAVLLCGLPLPKS